MATLESVVLPLAESRALAEKVKLDTALVWFVMTEGSFCQKVFPIGEVPYDPGVSYELVPAPVLSELLDAIRAKGYGDIRFDWNLSVPSERRCMAIVANSTNGEHHAYGATDLLAAASLLLEVAK